jgi:rhodanese-related sulfurtransferase/thioredoxin-related protein
MLSIRRNSRRRIAMAPGMIRKWFCGLLLLPALGAAADELAWHTDLAEAQAQARREGKSVLLVFRGSDWCPPCIEMERQVFKSPEFVAYAQKALVLVNVDFPETGAQDANVKRANLALKAKFNVGDNLPTLALLNESGETLFQEAGYSGGGSADALAMLQRHVKAPGTNGFASIGVEEFAKLAGDKNNVILDVRTPQEYEAGHLAGAVNLDFNAPDFLERIKALDKNKTYLVHCASGGRSARACAKLAQVDFPRLYNLAGGIHAWIKAGEPVVKP